MSEQLLDVKYECTHPSCQVFCKKGEFTIEEGEFKELLGMAEGDEMFRSPGACRMGYNQVFKAVSTAPVDESAVSEEEKDTETEVNVFTILMDEHEKVLETLDILDNQVKKRDLDGLWVSSSRLENDILLHSIKKEELFIFPFIRENVTMGEALCGIMDEDHREFISLLHAFRVGLQENEVLDGLVNSLIVNLRNHIKKENNELFPMASEKLSAEDNQTLLPKLEELEKAHITLDPGNRSDMKLQAMSEDRAQIEAEISSLKTVSSVGGEEMCCGGH
ncbi:MAG: hemerythrin domain-containing protein [Deltaproteobacteria bacterium]|nr:hemerythrin domain-containing protein [Deltaproteobacteria bacterium]